MAAGGAAERAGFDFAAHIRDVPDFPRPGIVFKDVTPLFGNPAAFRTAIDQLCATVADRRVDRVVGVEARGFVLAAPVAYHLDVGLVPVRKPGKLPWAVEHETYQLEYGSDRLEMHRDALSPGDQVLIVDDVLATGGTAAATTRLVERLGAVVMGYAFLIELAFLGGRAALPDAEVHTLLTYD